MAGTHSKVPSIPMQSWPMDKLLEYTDSREDLDEFVSAMAVVLRRVLQQGEIVPDDHPLSQNIHNALDTWEHICACKKNPEDTFSFFMVMSGLCDIGYFAELGDSAQTQAVVRRGIELQKQVEGWEKPNGYYPWRRLEMYLRRARISSESWGIPHEELALNSARDIRENLFPDHLKRLRDTLEDAEPLTEEEYWHIWSSIMGWIQEGRLEWDSPPCDPPMLVDVLVDMFDRITTEEWEAEAEHIRNTILGLLST